MAVVWGYEIKKRTAEEALDKMRVLVTKRTTRLAKTAPLEDLLDVGSS